MGHIYHHNIQEYIDKYNLDYFIETGTYLGDGLYSALSFNFKCCFSIEYLEEYFDHCVERFKNTQNCMLAHSDSINGLEFLFKGTQLHGNVLFWLDAHLPGVVAHIENYNSDDLSDDIKIPLLGELDVIFKYRPNNRDVFIMDDLRIYERGPFESGNINPEDYKINPQPLEYILDKFNFTHDIIKDYREQGYLIAVPK